ncbi:hypothetical protein CFP56_000381 [Quercus suber]|uniref:Uncharacterized protein n=1 Tax=Quercus suber TaxID=58331 RepID=A0AAW0M8I3_QUESU
MPNKEHCENYNNKCKKGTSCSKILGTKSKCFPDGFCLLGKEQPVFLVAFEAESIPFGQLDFPFKLGFKGSEDTGHA